jgi:hypothetical protein
MRQVQNVEDPKDEGVADREERIDAPEEDAVD